MLNWLQSVRVHLHNVKQALVSLESKKRFSKHTSWKANLFKISKRKTQPFQAPSGRTVLAFNPQEFNRLLKIHPIQMEEGSPRLRQPMDEVTYWAKILDELHEPSFFVHVAVQREVQNQKIRLQREELFPLLLWREHYWLASEQCWVPKRGFETRFKETLQMKCPAYAQSVAHYPHLSHLWEPKDVQTHLSLSKPTAFDYTAEKPHLGLEPWFSHFKRVILALQEKAMLHQTLPERPGLSLSKTRL